MDEMKYEGISTLNERFLQSIQRICEANTTDIDAVELFEMFEYAIPNQ